MKKILLMPVKNEDWILEYSLSCASLWADHIIIADQKSTDKTRDIYMKFPKVIAIENSSDFHSGSVRKLLLDEARKIPGNNLLFSLDADEILSANILDDVTSGELLAHISPGDSVSLQWINLWQSPDMYRDDDSVWSNSWKHFIFYDNREYDYEFTTLINDHSARVPGESIPRTYTDHQIKVLHFQFLGKERMLSKQRRYRVHDLIQQENSLLNNIKLNLKYYPTKIDGRVSLAKIHTDWVQGYMKNNIDQNNIAFSTEVYWYDEYVLEKISNFGTHYFRLLDIWDTDWNKKAKSIGLSGDFSDPRTWIIKMYHASQRYLALMVACIPSFIKNKI